MRVRCLSLKGLGMGDEHVDWSAFERCMCHSGVTSYCTRRLFTPKPFGPPEDDQPDQQTHQFHDLSKLLDEIHSEVHPPKFTIAEKPKRGLDAGIILVLTLLALMAVVYALTQFRCSGARTRRDGADRGTDTQRRRSRDR